MFIVKKILVILLAFVLCFAGCSGNEKTDFICGIVEGNIYKNELFDVAFEIPENWEAKAPDFSENKEGFIDDWSFEEKGGIGSFDICSACIMDIKNVKDAYEYMFNFVNDIYGEAIVEKRVETVVIDGEEKDFVLLKLEEDGFECYVGVLEKFAVYEDENWFMWESFLFENEEKVIDAIETVTSGKVKTEEIVHEQIEDEIKEKITPACGTFENNIFKNETFGIGFVVPEDWQYYEPEGYLNEDTEHFWDWEFEAQQGFDGLSLFYMKFSEDDGVTEEMMISLGTDMDFEEHWIDNVTIDGKEKKCVFGRSSLKYTLYIPKIIRDKTGGWACAIRLTSDSKDTLFEYAERLSWDVENIEKLADKINKAYEFDFVAGKLIDGKICNETTEICFTTPEGWKYIPEEELYRENNASGFFQDIYCIGEGVETITIDYQKYNYFGGKARTKESIFAIRAYEDDNKYGITLVSEEMGTVEHCGMEIPIKEEVYDFGKDMVHCVTMFVEKDAYAVLIFIAYEEDCSLEEFLPYIDLEYK